MKNKILMEAGEDTSEQYNHGKPQKLRHRRGGGGERKAPLKLHKKRQSCLTEKFKQLLFAAPVASADAKLLLSVATESNQRTPRGG